MHEDTIILLEFKYLLVVSLLKKDNETLKKRIADLEEKIVTNVKRIKVLPHKCSQCRFFMNCDCLYRVQC